MADIEKVINGLNYCTHTDGVECPNCPYWQYDDCVETLHTDVLALLKEYKRQDGCPCQHCMEWECDEVCEEYKKWRDS